MSDPTQINNFIKACRQTLRPRELLSADVVMPRIAQLLGCSEQEAHQLAYECWEAGYVKAIGETGNERLVALEG